MNNKKSKIKQKKFKKTKTKHIKKNYTIKNNKHKKMYKGGFEGIYNIQDVLHILNNYSTIYIAIGAKYITSNYPSNVQNTGIYQLVPDFILNESFTNEGSKTLIIIIDNFKEEELLFNNRVMKNILENITNIDHVFINHLFDETIKNQIASLIQCITTQNIYIVDYVYFFNPNLTDEENSRVVNNLLNQLLELLVNRCGVENSFKLPPNKNIYKWLGNIEPNYISKFILYDYIWSHIGLAKRTKDTKKIMSCLIHCLRITPDYI